MKTMDKFSKLWKIPGSIIATHTHIQKEVMQSISGKQRGKPGKVQHTKHERKTVDIVTSFEAEGV